MANVYLAGHCLNRGSQLLRREEAQLVEQLGHKLYNPMDNKEINDKATADPVGLAERIVKHDTDAILWSDTVIIEPDSAALGTHVELGQLLGMKDLAEMVINLIDDCERSPEEVLGEIYYLCTKQKDREVFPHLEDIRMSEVPEQGIRRSFSINQYVVGACLALTGGRGFYTMDEIRKELGGK